MKNLKLFLSGFMQVFLVVLNTYFIAKDILTGVIICSFGISYFWSHNVKKVAFGKEVDRIIYATGAMSGGVLGYFLGKLLISLQ
jgi:hypothetical protein